MTDSDKTSSGVPEASLEQLSEILRENPGAFKDHPELLEFIDIPDRQEEGVASLFEKQAQVLRDKISRLSLSVNDMVEAARENELTSDRLFQVTCDLLATDDLESVLDSLYSNLKEKFNVEWVTLRVSAASDSPGIAEINPSHADSDAYTEVLAMVKRQSHCDERLPVLLLEYLFGERSDDVQSVAIIPLHTNPRGGRPIGLLALGSAAKQQFQPGLGTMHLDRLGKILGIFIQKHVEPTD